MTSSSAPARAGVLLAPGAGSDRDQASLLMIEELLAPVPVVRMDFPYRKAGKKIPDKTPVLLEAVRAEVAAMGGAPVVLGGRSMGGRMCSMAVASGLLAPTTVLGLALISYPLHPPGKPDRLRTEHLPALDVPCLFVSGTRDAFGTPDELQAATGTIPGPVTHVWIEGGDHSLRRKDAQVAAVVADWIRTLLS